MKGEIISLKSVNVSDNIIYSNCETISTHISRLGIELPFVTYVDNNSRDIFLSLQLAFERSDIIFLSGGCGTSPFGKDILCQFLHYNVQKNSFYSEHLRNFCMQKGLNLQPSFEDSSYLPANCIVFPDYNGPFSAFSISVSNKLIITLPDQIYDMERFLDEQIIPFIANKLGLYYSRVTLKAFNADKPALDYLISKLCRRNNLKFFTEENCGVSVIHLSAFAITVKEADNICENAVGKIKSFLGDKLFEIGNRSLAQVTVEALKRLHIKVSTAESCTGGMISEMITDVPGASDILEIGLCAYSNRVKQYAIGVSENILNTYGAVSKETCIAMSNGIHEIGNSNLGVATTGVAGPAISEDKPVGTVYVSISDGKNDWVENLNLNSSLDRDSIRRYAANTALDLLRKYCLYYPERMPESESNLSKASEKESTNNLSPTYNSNDTYFCIDDDLISPNIETISQQEVSVSPQAEETSINPLNPKKAIKFLLFFFVSLICLVTGVITYSLFDINVQEKFLSEVQSIHNNNSNEKAFFLLKDINNDYEAWLSSEDNTISLPVCNGNNTNYYRTHNFNGKKSADGNLYFENSNIPYNNEISKNLIIYGNNPKSGDMFASLLKYESLNYLNANSVFTLQTETATLHYQVFAVFTADKNFVHYNNDENYEQWYDQVYALNFYRSDITISPDDKFLTLVTDDHIHKDSTFIVIAKKVASKEPINYNVNANRTH